MSDQSVTTETVPATEPSTTVPEPVVVTPAVHGDTLWGGPQWVTNVTRDPVWVETKQEYWDLLKKHGKQMKHMQESDVRSSVEELPDPVPLSLQPTPPPAPFTQAEAVIIASMTPIFKRYGLREALYCTRCFTRNRDHGCRQSVSGKGVEIECRCGRASYRPPTGTTDLTITTLANYPVKELDRTKASVLTGHVSRALPAVILNDTEAQVIRAYADLCKRRDYEPRWFCRACWDGVSLDESQSVGIKITSHQITLLCQCRVLFAQDSPTAH